MSKKLSLCVRLNKLTRVEKAEKDQPAKQAIENRYGGCSGHPFDPLNPDLGKGWKTGICEPFFFSTFDPSYTRTPSHTLSHFSPAVIF